MNTPEFLDKKSIYEDSGMVEIIAEYARDKIPFASGINHGKEVLASVQKSITSLLFEGSSPSDTLYGHHYLIERILEDARIDDHRKSFFLAAFIQVYTDYHTNHSIRGFERRGGINIPDSDIRKAISVYRKILSMRLHQTVRKSTPLSYPELALQVLQPIARTL